jgi:hypothetical protein
MSTRPNVLGEVFYFAHLRESELMRVTSSFSEPKEIRFGDLLNCLGNPDSYSVELFTWGDGFPGVVTNAIFLYYVESDLLVEVIISAENLLTTSGTPVRFSRDYVFPDGGLRPTMDNRAHPIFPQADIRPWVAE